MANLKKKFILIIKYIFLFQYYVESQKNLYSFVGLNI